MSHHTHQKPIQAGIFASVEHAEDAVRQLLDAGFEKKEIFVVCSDESIKSHFEKFRPTQQVAENEHPVIAETAFAGGVLGALVSLAGVVTTGGIGVVVVGPILVGTIAGTLLGLLVGRGIEDELARFYDQAVGKGDILVAVEVYEEDERQAERLAEAAKILKDRGTEPFPLNES